MRGMRVPEHEILGLCIADAWTEERHRHANPEVFFMLQGTLSFQLGEARFPVHEGDFFLVRPGEAHGHSADAPVLYCCLQLDNRAASRFLDMEQLRCSVEDSRRDFFGNRELRRQMQKILSLYLSREPHAPLLLNSAYFAFLYYLAEYYEQGREEKRDLESARVRRLQQWVYRHYTEDVQLGDLAAYMGLTPAYLSKYFKRVFGRNFLEFLTALRLEGVCADLGRHPERSILRIAYDNGFTNITSFNKAFKTAFGVKPSEYRAGLGREPEVPADARPLAALQNYIETVLPEEEPAARRAERCVSVRADIRLFREARYPWNRAVSLGRATDLLSAEVQAQTLLLRRELGVGYIRLWELFSPEFLPRSPENGTCDYSRLDRVMDFLVENRLHPYIVVSPRHTSFAGNAVWPAHGGAPQPSSAAPGDFARLLHLVVEHCFWRYGWQELEEWRFELCYDWLEESDAWLGFYCDCLDAARAALRDLLPQVRIGGPGGDALRVLERCAGAAEGAGRFPAWDFITAGYFEDESFSAPPQTFIGTRRLHREDYFPQWMEKLRSRADACGYAGRPIHVSQWNFSASDRNILNDSQFNAAYIVKSGLEMLDKTELLCHWTACDAVPPNREGQGLLFGGTGLLSKNGLKKPAYYAFLFMKFLKRHVAARGKNYLITTDGVGGVRILCHNYVHPQAGYQRFQGSVGGILELFSDGEDLTLRFSLEGLQETRYFIKSQFLLQREGNLLASWLEIRDLEVLSRDDLEYLQGRSMPLMQVETRDTEQGTLRWETTLKPNEIRSILIAPGHQR